MTRTVLITGASQGIGRATARHFRRCGWNVIATMRTPEEEEQFRADDAVFVTRLDVQDHASIDGAVEAGLARFGAIDALVNNAGYGAYGPLEASPIEAIRRQFEVNVIGLLATTKALLPHFRTSGRGTVVNISSSGGRVAFPLGTAYHGSKFAVEGLSEALLYELEPLGIRVKIVEPGMTRTGFVDAIDFSNDIGLREYQPLVERLMNVMGPMAENGAAPESVAEVIYAATTDGSDRLRYAAGDDAVHLLSNWRASDETAFLAGMKAQFGLAE